ncbi:MAG TPA: cupin domain-containing protein [Bryobacteraceae bacterium]|nr:cupin domain-containing protein [Bryobacteraceae bacterium]
MPASINLDEKFGLFTEHWRPKVVAALNGQEVKLVKVLGEFPWHPHEQEDELFLVWKGTFRVEFRDHVVSMGPGECVVVPRGVEHRTCADEEAQIICFEPRGVVNTGNVRDATFTAPNGAGIQQPLRHTDGDRSVKPCGSRC